MKSNRYFKSLYKRTNVIKETLLSIFFGIGSGPRLLLEVFIRRNMGERYFSFSTAIFLLVVLSIIPAFSQYGFAIFSKVQMSYYQFNLFSFLGKNLTWYIFLGAFLYCSIERRKEVKSLPSVYDMARFSLSAGTIHREFCSLKFGGNPVEIRTIETLIEPAFFFVIGFMLWVFDQNVGNLLMFCSVIYSLSYKAAYYQGDNFIMDHIDEMICGEELSAVFIDGKKPEEARGFSFYGHRPANIQTRRRVAETFFEKETVEVL
ncbi:hypothetical protein [Arcicella lustrica]|uniref:ABC transmembrane type-1 domain-containing protein n=1 Tax=Arcicella lustrica TaxID=2984196 RepID=A0ABU5SGK2_9BACT|nr:hypothetical protein [Arcicella sp. DC25W]MEA5426389.1 hypothetical protein [Arcicella sp. DC25W]